MVASYGSRRQAFSEAVDKTAPQRYRKGDTGFESFALIDAYGERGSAVCEAKTDLNFCLDNWHADKIEHRDPAAEAALAHKLIKATANGNEEKVQRLLTEEEATPNVYDANGGTPLHFTAYYNYPGIAKLLLKHKADVNAHETCTTDATPLHAAAVNGHAGMVSLLLAARAHPDALNAMGKTALDVATVRRRSAVEALLRPVTTPKVRCPGIRPCP
eukprot:gnl/MRDRNA2_/MRDRNA2_27497_c0_seq1.p1 gnl/MRDRNA2_/MRDRNA2_27497_c0~~gnl/MRDRNA2_/MRDRNA2_27497_c0_seq1.p1  ORF type:complete len:216 (-),score=39.31 gnl/MRDRNA2_/MRDRNA2_27497_c0_seq1:202-849(-)